MQSRHAIGALLMAVGLCVSPTVASAQAPSSEARASFQEGVQNFGARRFAEALVAFGPGLRVRPHPSVMVNIANCYLALEQPLEAISSFERYLHNAAQVSPEQRARNRADHRRSTAAPRDVDHPRAPRGQRGLPRR